MAASLSSPGRDQAAKVNDAPIAEVADDPCSGWQRGILRQRLRQAAEK
jgi:hypothetical protein